MEVGIDRMRRETRTGWCGRATWRTPSDGSWTLRVIYSMAIMLNGEPCMFVKSGVSCCECESHRMVLKLDGIDG